MKWVKRILVGVLTLAVLVIGGAFAALKLMDVDKIRTFLQAQIEANTGRTVTIAGDVVPTIGFMPTVTLQNVTLSNPKWSTEPSLIQAQELHVALRLIPLISNVISISEVRIVGADIAIQKSKKGTMSWNFKADEEKLQQIEEQQEGAAKTLFSIDRLSMKDSKISYQDLKTGKKYAVDVADLVVANIAGDTVGNIELNGIYKKSPLRLQASLTESVLLLDAALNGESVKATAKGSMALADSTFDGQIDLDTKELRNLLSLFGTKSDNRTALKLKTEIGGKADIIAFSKLDARYDTYPFTGSGSINLTGALPYINAKIASPEISFKGADPVVETVATESSIGDKSPVTATFIPPVELPITGFDAFTADVDLSIKKIVLNKFTLKDFTATLAMKDQRFAAKPIRFSTSEGWVTGSTSLDAKMKPQRFYVYLIINDLNLSKFIAELKGDSPVKDGLFKGQFTLKGQGKTLAEVFAKGDGNLNFFMDEASYTTPPAAVRAADFISLLRGGDSSGAVKVNCMVGRFKMLQGKADSQALAVKTGGAIVTGNGSLNFSNDTIDMLLKARSSSVDLADLVPALRLSGPLASPSAYPDPGSALLSIGKYVLGAATGVGLIAIIGEKAADTIGLTADNNPCIQSIVEIEQTADNRDPGETVEQLTKDAKGGIKAIENEAKSLRDGVKGLIGN